MERVNTKPNSDKEYVVLIDHGIKQICEDKAISQQRRPYAKKEVIDRNHKRAEMTEPQWRVTKEGKGDWWTDLMTKRPPHFRGKHMLLLVLQKSELDYMLRDSASEIQCVLSAC